MSLIGTIHEDVTTDVLGDIGSWQWFVTLMTGLLMTSSVFNHHEDIFFIHPSKATCIPSDDYDDPYDINTCSYTTLSDNGTIEVPCEKWQMQILWCIWIKKSWFIFCEDRMKLLLSAVIYRLATVFGFVIFGLVADSFGRKAALLFDVFTSTFLRLVIAFCDSSGWFRLVVFLLALFGSAKMYMGLIIVTEIASNKWRSWLSVIVMSPRLFALVCMVPLVNSIPNIETYNIIASVFGIMFIVITLKWIPESPQWMLYNRKIFIAEKLLTKAALQNDINFSADFKIRPVNQRAYICLDDTTTILRVMTKHNIRVVILVTLVFWGLYFFLWSCLYFRVYSQGIQKSLLLQVFCFLVAYIVVAILLSNKLKLQRILIIHLLLIGVFSSGHVIITQPIVRDILDAIALASGLVVHSLILNITPRIYATNIRASLTGSCYAMGQVGALISYIMFVYDATDDRAFIGLQMGVALILIALSFLLPDVDGRELPDIIEDMDYFSELSKPLRWATQKRQHPSKEEVEMRVYSFGSNLATSSEFERQQQRIPAQPIGFVVCWRRLVNYVQTKISQYQT